MDYIPLEDLLRGATKVSATCAGPGEPVRVRFHGFSEVISKTLTIDGPDPTVAHVEESRPYDRMMQVPWDQALPLSGKAFDIFKSCVNRSLQLTGDRAVRAEYNDALKAFILWGLLLQNFAKALPQQFELKSGGSRARFQAGMAQLMKGYAGLCEVFNEIAKAMYPAIAARKAIAAASPPAARRTLHLPARP